MSLSINVITDVEVLKRISEQSNTKIPKIIHYCWFGGKPLPDDLQKCFATWEKLQGYTIMRWDESNCSFDENDFIKNAYKDKKFAFISDFYRVKALYEYGGIYLDTDVKVNKSFDDLLDNAAFLNFIFDCSVGTAIIGSEKGNPLTKGILDMYYDTVLLPGPRKTKEKVFEYKDGKLYVHGYTTNNYYYTYYILKHYPEFVLNNRYQDLKDFVIYPKELFEIGTITGKHYAIHLNSGNWRVGAQDDGAKGKIKKLLQNNDVVYDKVQVIVRKIRYWKLNKAIPFYQYSRAQVSGKPLPEL
ncbi:MAG: hypothetical protein IJI01_02560 [Butyrivibrio sp.]|uniref:glycosyltransferase family 32 protein n=1 Tax=Butyrivibrio sp. TaxID=28121 RepID=UPI0025BE2A78|nr:glycosyltransferase [Butyrivibrio sp.]MBQ6587543.1 hypothetical protein [Butyrivibrio sp.]